MEKIYDNFENEDQDVIKLTAHNWDRLAYNPDIDSVVMMYVPWSKKA